MLGPARFTHIEHCALEVCRAFKRKEELNECLSTLSTLDDILGQLRSELADLIPEDATSSTTRKHAKKPDYSGWISSDLPKARRIITARESAITTVKTAIAKRREAMR